MATAAIPAAPARALISPETTPRPRIAEIEGLRGIALTLVVLFHLFGNGRISGGVDVFLVISAFLLSRSMFRKAMQPGGPRLLAHFGGVAARLVPSAAIVLAFVTAVTLTLLPAASQRQNLQEVLASALYYENWELISSQLAYGAAGPNASPLQHFWSLSVQGQFFLIWPFIVIAIVWAARRVRASAEKVLVSVTVVFTLASATYAFWISALDQPMAYFSTFARFWELGVGAVLGLVLPHLRLGRVMRVVFSWAGLALIVTCGFFIDGGQLFPGPWTLWPVLGTVLVIAGAGAESPPGPARVLDAGVLRFFARISYPLYLWHWPLLVFYIQLRGQDGVEWKGAALIFAVSVVAAWLTQRLIEAPVTQLRRSLPGGALLALALGITVVLAGATTVVLAKQDAEQKARLEAMAAPSPDHIGAQALLGTELTADDVAILPDPTVAFDDLPEVYEKECIQNYRGGPGMDQVLVCESDVESPAKTVIMTGGSHAEQWYPAVAAIAAQENWALVVIDKDGCRLSMPDASDGISSCESWTEKAITTIIDRDPDLVFTVGTETASPEADQEYLAEAQIAAWRELAEAGVPVIAMRDTPRFSFRVPECVQATPARDVAACGIDRSATYAEVSPFLTRSDIPEGVTQIDLSDAFCTERRCEPVVGNVLVYRDDDHMTATYALTLAPALREALQAAAPSMF